MYDYRAVHIRIEGPEKTIYIVRGFPSSRRRGRVYANHPNSLHGVWISAASYKRLIKVVNSLGSPNFIYIGEFAIFIEFPDLPSPIN